MTTRIPMILAGACLAAMVAAGGSTLADTVVEVSNLPYEGTILRITGEGLVLNWKIGGTRVMAYSQIKKVSVDKEPDLDSAEDARLSEEYKNAISAYERAKLRAKSKWLKEYINARLVQCFAETSQFSRAVKTYIDLAQGGSALSSWVSLPPVMPKGSPDNDAALKAVEAALAAAPEAPYADRLKELRLNILLVQGDPGQVLAEVESMLDSDSPEHRATMRLKHIELLLMLGRIDDAKKSLDIAQNGLGDKHKPLDAQYEPELLFFEGRYQYAKKDYLHSAMSFMRVPIHFRRKRELSADSLYWAAKSMLDSQMVPLPEVAEPLQEAIEKYPGTEGATKAQEMLDKLSKGDS